MSGSSVSSRSVRYDLLRALSVLAILTAHAMPSATVGFYQWLINRLLIPVLSSFVGIYFMLSGMFLLEQGNDDIGAFYRKRFLSVGIPFLVYDYIYYAYHIFTDGPGLWQLLNLPRFLLLSVTAQIPGAGHLWFMYALFAFYLCTPFLARMMKALNDRDLKILLLLMAALSSLDVLGEITGYRITPWQQYILYTGWVYYYLLGYGLRRLSSKKQIPCFLLLCVVGLCFELWRYFGIPDWIPENPHKSPVRIVLSIAIFLIFEHYGDQIPARLAQIAAMISRRSYSIYLIHFLILSCFVQPVLIRDLPTRHYLSGTLLSAAITFFLSLTVGFFVDKGIVEPLQKLARWAFSLIDTNKR
ncbi:MAG: acyltransferase [Clostridiales bacterium]|nr:acyltransferase [Clostridiales bacterium]